MLITNKIIKYFLGYLKNLFIILLLFFENKILFKIIYKKIFKKKIPNSKIFS